MESRSRSSSASGSAQTASKTVSSRSISASIQQITEAGRDGAPLLAVVAAHPADGADRDTLLAPAARFQRETQHGAQHFEVARFPPDQAADFGIHVGGHESCDGGMVTGETEREIVL
jgi:hypothetical protein